MDILEFSDDILKLVLSGLAPKDLAAMSLQCWRLRKLTYESSVWEDACKRRWSSYPYGIRWTWVEAGGWAVTYRQLAALHDNTMQAVGQSCAMHRNWSEIEIPDPQDIHGAQIPFEFDTMMHAVFDVGAAAYKSPEVLNSYAVAVLRRDLRAWLSTAPHVVLIFMQHLRELLVPFDPWVDPEHKIMDDISWRRSAIDFLPQVAATGSGPSQQASVLRDLAREVTGFDADLRAEMEAASLELPSVPPNVLPESHWWWSVKEAPAVT